MTLSKSMFQNDLTFAIGDFDETILWSTETIQVFAPSVDTGLNLDIDGFASDVESMTFYANKTSFAGTPAIGDEITYRSTTYRIKRLLNDIAQAWLRMECEAETN